MESPKWTVKFEKVSPEFDSNSFYYLDISVEIAGVIFTYNFEDLQNKSIQDYQDFASGKRKELTFSEWNGLVGIERTEEHVKFHNDHFENCTTICIPIAKCDGFFEALATGRVGCETPTPVLYKTIEGLTKVELLDGCFVANFTPREMHGQIVTKMNWSTEGFNSTHRDDIISMTVGQVKKVTADPVKISERCLSLGLVLRSDGVRVFFGPEAKTHLDILPYAIPLSKCVEGLIQLAFSL